MAGPSSITCIFFCSSYRWFLGKKERAGGAFAAVIAFILIDVITGALFGITSDMLADPEAVTHTLFGKEILVNGYFTSVLGAPALNMGVFVGIISGFVGRHYL